jgi:Raf kinase inhibitor-like YbhB/YbcL family protein
MMVAGTGARDAGLGSGVAPEVAVLEKMPPVVGRAMRGMRAGRAKVISARDELAALGRAISLESPVFTDGGAIPARFTADGAGLSPPLRWRGVPDAAEALVLIIEDADAPAPTPLVHLLAWDLPPDLTWLAEGQFPSPGHDGDDEVLGRNAFLKPAYLPPDPPPGRGPHLYVFQLFAVDRRLDLHGTPSRDAVWRAMDGHVIAKGILAGTYARP